MELVAELKEVKMSKTVSLDAVYRLVLLTPQQEVLDLGKLPPDTLLKVTFEVDK